MAELPHVDSDEIAKIEAIAGSENDGPVLMLNLNRYAPEVGYPDGEMYEKFLSIVTQVVNAVGGKILWRTTVHGHVVGNQDFDEALGIWYPTHQAFLDLMTLPGQEENMRLRAMMIEHASLLRCEAY